MRVDSFSAYLASELRQCGFRFGNSDYQIRSARAEGFAEVGDGVEEERGAVWPRFVESGSRFSEIARVEEEDGEEGEGVCGGGSKGLMVMDTEVGAEPDDGASASGGGGGGGLGGAAARDGDGGDEGSVGGEILGFR